MNYKSNPPASVLFVDDEDKARKYFALALASDFDIKTAGSAAEALEILRQQADQIAIIVSDQRMPEKTGVELLKTVRDYYPHVIRLLTTAYTDLDDAIEAINRGEILRYIQKPWDINTLKTELKQAQIYFQLKNERDCLLAEKLSVKQRLVQIERITQLLLIAEALPWLRFANHAVRNYINLVTNKALVPDSVPADTSLLLDLWSQTLSETARMQKFTRSLTTALGSILPVNPAFNTPLELASLQLLLQDSARDAGVSMQVLVNNAAQLPALDLMVDLPLFKLLLHKLLAVIRSMGKTNQTIVTSISLEPADNLSDTRLRLAFAFPETNFAVPQQLLTGPVTSDIPECCSDLLLALLACAHHGGSLLPGNGAERGWLVLRLPTKPAIVTLAPDTADWHEHLLLSFEPDLE